jgi:hypothetical protein
VDGLEERRVRARSPGREQLVSYTIETEFDGRLSVCDGDVNVLATFDPDYADLAEEMRDRLTIRHLARVADFMRCSICGRPAIAKRIPLGGVQVVFTHEDGAEHARELK